MSRPGALAAALLALLAAGCLETGGGMAEGCAERAARGVALAHATSETRVPAVDAARVDVADASGLRSWAVTARGRTLHQVVTLGEGGVTLERPPDEAPILRAHVLVQPTDEAIAPAQSPRIQVDLAEPLPPGGYRIEVCLQEIRALPRDEGPPQVLRLDATAT